jgi:hypothetical protein
MTVRERETQRNWFLWGWLALLIAYNVFTLISYVNGGNNPILYSAPLEGMPQEPRAIGAIASLAAIVGELAIGLGYRWGWYLTLVAWVGITVAGLLIGFNIGLILMLLLAMGILWFVMRPSWSNMR